MGEWREEAARWNRGVAGLTSFVACGRLSDIVTGRRWSQGWTTPHGMFMAVRLEALLPLLVSKFSGLMLDLVTCGLLWELVHISSHVV